MKKKVKQPIVEAACMALATANNDFLSASFRKMVSENGEDADTRVIACELLFEAMTHVGVKIAYTDLFSNNLYIHNGRYYVEATKQDLLTILYRFLTLLKKNKIIENKDKPKKMLLRGVLHHFVIKYAERHPELRVKNNPFKLYRDEDGGVMYINFKDSVLAVHFEQDILIKIRKLDKDHASLIPFTAELPYNCDERILGIKDFMSLFASYPKFAELLSLYGSGKTHLLCDIGYALFGAGHVKKIVCFGSEAVNDTSSYNAIYTILQEVLKTSVIKIEQGKCGAVLLKNTLKTYPKHNQILFVDSNNKKITSKQRRGLLPLVFENSNDGVRCIIFSSSAETLNFGSYKTDAIDVESITSNYKTKNHIPKTLVKSVITEEPCAIIAGLIVGALQ